MTMARHSTPAGLVLSHDRALVHPGTLLAPDGTLVAPYDIEHGSERAERHAQAAPALGLLHAASRPFRLDYGRVTDVHVINGMGVALGDSVIGLTALAALRAMHPGLRFTLYRPARAPRYVDALYALAADVVAPSRALPYPADALPAGAPCIDVGNHLYWPAFARQPMIDFFVDALGADPAAVPAAAKRNRWLARLTLPALPAEWQRPYVLFCPTASTAVRSVPRALHAACVERLAQRYGLPVVGFGAVAHAAYVDVSRDATDTARFLAWVKGASVLFAPDTAALHVADGFDVPTLGCFTTIDPALRVRDYPHCVPVSLDVPADLHGLHRSERPDDLAAVESAYRAIDWDALPWPAPRDAAATAG
ncbi:ADP-heptose--LPS heptosyltransferase [Burkholderia latens]|uniref:ADP-heptose--LPS heptosyltransferase n=1 Tax=Burkholderia latens TaxID=488446 RepID=A0AAP1C3T9_9BURK|nr:MULTISPECIES: ADP-heptose--LPS heptosyltransferase [Burkholderia]AOK03343.1 ADP-heptose--LPS heptosyltransferase [Burkholderia latens]KVA00802.1 ADP-heptose--LPS heptosyltransferase [Burkholderia latens]MBY4696377.1 ADP-heptose--LPS heptosyltransferase [Burkholderia latens]MCA8310631.1 ADP-heptose--LPS heptosyltransferase [Burkholderia sp. AU28942]QTO48680.1 ADP-heptose--LPS heptosyltransferase [Burkholderia latens]